MPGCIRAAVVGLLALVRQNSRFLNLCHRALALLGSGVAPFCPFYCMVPSLKLNMWKKGTLIFEGSLRNLVFERSQAQRCLKQPEIPKP